MNLKAFLHDAAYERHEASGCTCPDYPWRVDPACPEHGHLTESCNCVLPEQSCKVCRAQARKTYRSTLED